ADVIAAFVGHRLVIGALRRLDGLGDRHRLVGASALVHLAPPPCPQGPTAAACDGTASSAAERDVRALHTRAPSVPAHANRTPPVATLPNGGPSTSTCSVPL